MRAKSSAESAREAGDFDAALGHLDAGLRSDAEHNAGKRANEYAARKGQLLSKKGEADAAYEAFRVLLDGEPDDVRPLGTATESFLSLGQGQRAAEFAEKGLELARKQNNRDSEGYFMELSEAAKKQA